MPDLLAVPPAAVAAGLVLAATSPSHGAVVRAAAPQPCHGDQVAVVVDFNQLGGPTRAACLDTGGTAAELFESAGFALTEATTPGMQGFVCTISGKPEDRQCTRGDSYWSLWWSGEADQWAYATLGARQLEVEPGGAVGFAWHQGEGDAAAPDLAPSGAGAAEEPGAGAAASPGAGDPDAGDLSADDPPARSAVPTWLLVAAAAVVLGAAGAVPLLRRRRSS